MQKGPLELEADIDRPRHPPWQSICLEFMSPRKIWNRVPQIIRFLIASFYTQQCSPLCVCCLPLFSILCSVDFISRHLTFFFVHFYCDRLAPYRLHFFVSGQKKKNKFSGTGQTRQTHVKLTFVLRRLPHRCSVSWVHLRTSGRAPSLFGYSLRYYHHIVLIMSCVPMFYTRGSKSSQGCFEDDTSWFETVAASESLSAFSAELQEQ